MAVTTMALLATAAVLGATAVGTAGINAHKDLKKAKIDAAAANDARQSMMGKSSKAPMTAAQLLEGNAGILSNGLYSATSARGKMLGN